MTKITINGREVEADPKRPLIAACHEHAEELVPMYCYHPGLTPVGSCRICQVEVKMGEMPPRVVVACRTPVSEGMVVNTEAPGAHDARRQCLEFLLKNHPLDCPICDKAGECDLQDYSFSEGQGEGRSVEPRRKLEKRKSLGDTILLDQERCILCSRCVRFYEDVAKQPQLTVAGLGSRSVISTFADRPLHGNYQGNIADICPVGALTLKKFRFQARVWNLDKHPSTCGECSRGCSISIEVLRRREVKRVRPRYDKDKNKWWMCDHGRFAFDRFNADDRLVGGFLRGAQGLEPKSLERVFDDLAENLRRKGEHVLLVSPWLTVEEGELVRDLAQATGATTRFVSPAADTDLRDDFLHTGDPCPNRRGLTELGFEAVEAADVSTMLAGATCVVLVGESVGELVTPEALAALPRSIRLFLLDTRAYAAPALRGALGVPDASERTGTWINVDGHPGRLAIAKAAPDGVPPLERSLRAVQERLDAGAEVRA